MKNGDNIIKKVEELKRRGVELRFEKRDSDNVYVSDKTTYKLELVVNPTRWLGLDFITKDNQGKVQLAYSIDTDLYPISNPDQEWFADEIESDIVKFLALLENNEVMVGKVKGRPIMIFPCENGYRFVKKGRFFIASRICTASEYEKLSKNLEHFKLAG